MYSPGSECPIAAPAKSLRPVGLAALRLACVAAVEEEEAAGPRFGFGGEAAPSRSQNRIHHRSLAQIPKTTLVWQGGSCLTTENAQNGLPQGRGSSNHDSNI